MKKENSASSSAHAPLFGNLRILCAAAILAAISVVLNQLSIQLAPDSRLGFGDLPILISGIFFGPVIGGMVGLLSDLLGCLFRGDIPAPLITLGAVLVGAVSGLISHLTRAKGWSFTPPAICAEVALGYTIGAVLVKSLGIALLYQTPFAATLVSRAPLCAVTAIIECIVILLLARNKLFMGQLARLLDRKKGRK